MHVSLTMPLLLILLGWGALLSSGLGCQPRDFGHGSIVCVCDAKYCDQYPPPVKTHSREFEVIISSKDGGERLKSRKKNFDLQCKEKGTYITLNPKEKYQKITCIGTSITDAATLEASKLSPEVLNALHESLWPDTTCVRIPIAGSDFSTRPYTYADTPSRCTNNKESDLKDFELQPEDLYKISFIKKALEMRPEMTILGSAWSAPAWMKDSNNLVGGSLKEECYETWAYYHKLFLDKYKENGVVVHGVTTGNEGFSALDFRISWNSMSWGTLTLGQWVTENFGPMLEGSGVGIYAFDDQRDSYPWRTSIIASIYPKFLSYVSGFAIHGYLDKITPACQLDKQKEQYPEKEIWMTEYSITPQFNPSPSGGAVTLGDWGGCDAYADSMIENFQHWVSAYIDWNFALDLNGGPNWAGNRVDAPIIMNETDNLFYKQPSFYCRAHFSKYVRPGSTRIYSKITKNGSGNCDINGVAFYNPNQTVLVLHSKWHVSNEIYRYIGNTHSPVPR